MPQLLPADPLVVCQGGLLLLLPALQLPVIVANDLHLLVEALGCFPYLVSLPVRVFTHIAEILHHRETAIGDQVSGIVESHPRGVRI